MLINRVKNRVYLKDTLNLIPFVLAEFLAVIKKIFITGLMIISTLVQADQYLLIMSKDDKVCQHMGSLYTWDLIKKGKVILENHQEYNWFTWDKEVIFKKEMSQIANKLRKYKKSVFDINNDGKNEEVLFKRSYFNWKLEYQIDDLTYVKDGYKINYDEDRIRNLNIQNKLVNLDTYNAYKLRELPIKSIDEYGTHYYNYMGGAFLVRPFKLQKKYYLSFFGNMGLESHVDITWQENVKNDISIKNAIVITHYDKNNTLHDVCYFIRPQPVIIKTGELK